MKKQLIIIIGLTLVLASTSIIPTLFAHPASDPYVTDLIAGQHYIAGNVSVWNDGDAIHVIYQTTGDWYITGTHLYVGKTDPNLLTSAPGQFPYSEPDESTETTHSYVIALDAIDGYHLKLNHGKPTGKWVANKDRGVETGDTIYIAAHAGVCREKLVSGSGLADLEAGLPDLVNVLATHSYEIGQSYFDVVISGGTSLDGTYNGWCIDTDHNMNTEQYPAYVYSSYGTFPGGIIEKPENLSLVNYILNQHYAGTPSGCDGDYTVVDVQLAIWTLIEDEVAYWPFDPEDYSQCRIDEIVADAETNGEGFEPVCGQIVAIILEPTEIVGDIGQIAIIEIPITCEYEIQCETAWGKGSQFPSANWAMYFTYTIQ